MSQFQAHSKSFAACVRALASLEDLQEYQSELVRLRTLSEALVQANQDPALTPLLGTLQSFATTATAQLFLDQRHIHRTLKLVSLALSNSEAGGIPELVEELQRFLPAKPPDPAPQPDIEDLFRQEGLALCDRLQQLLPQLSSDNKDLASINEAIRVLRTLEGAALAVELSEVESTCGKAISLFSKLTQRRTVADLDLGSVVSELVSALREVIQLSESERWTAVGRLLMLEGRLESLESEAKAPPPSLAQVISHLATPVPSPNPTPAPPSAKGGVPLDVAQAFRIEIEELATRISDLALQLEQSQGEVRDRVLEELFRDYHSLKGAARAAGFPGIESLCQSTEGVLVPIKRGQLELGPKGTELLYLSADTLISLAGQAQEQKPPSELLLALEAYIEKGEQADLPKLIRPTQNTVEIKAITRLPERESVRVPVSKLGNLSVLAEEMLSIKLAASQRATDLKAHQEAMEQWLQHWTQVHGDVASLGRQADVPADLERVLLFLNWSENFHSNLLKSISITSRRADVDRRQFSVLVDNLLEDSKRLLTFPLASLLQRYPKLVRDLCQDLGKSVRLEVEGAEVEIDRRIIERLHEPVLHLVRNALDHGFETPEERQKAGKPAQGVLKFQISPQPGNQVLICISDDGRGINTQKLREKAMAQGVAAAQARDMDEREAINLIFLSDLSTADKVTEISGRGLGMAIVREHIKRLGGTLRIESEWTRGTQFHILLPLTLSTFRGILTRVSGKLFVVPTVNTERVVRIHRLRDVHLIEGDPTITLEGRVVPLLSLSGALGLPAIEEEDSEYRLVLVFESGIKQVGFYVDEILSEQEVLVRRLQGPLAKLKKVTGVSVLGTGELAPIVNAPYLVEHARRQEVVVTKSAGASGKRGPADYQILLADDSLTSRTLIKHMLESEGYRVRTASDGAEALAMLRSGHWDLLVSDIEMPRLNGLELTRQVRQDRHLGRLPIILVSTLSGEQDQGRGLEAGANAYIIKGTLDQNDLVHRVRQLL